MNKLFIIPYYLLKLGEQYWSGLNNALLTDSGWYTVESTMEDNRI